MLIVCPICRQLLDRAAPAWRCAAGHSFDVARDGYVNLLPVQHKHSTQPGDSAASLAARRDFLEAGHYQTLRDALLHQLQALRVRNLLDIGCGEGYYTAAMAASVHETLGLDIAKPAIQLAARRYKLLRGITWLVASGAQLPLADAAVDAITCVFTQLHVTEMARVLRPGGTLLVITPAAGHLWNLREQLFGQVQAHEPDKFHAGFQADFELCEQIEVGCDLALTRATLAQLLTMTPYAWKARPERRAALEQSESFQTRATFSVMRLRRKDRLPS